MSSKHVLLAAACILLIAATSAAPLSHYFAINYETKQCGTYWGGDEFVNYDLPPHWNILYAQYSDNYTSIETAAGTCRVPRPQASFPLLARECCAQLGYTYVSDNVGIYRLTEENIRNQNQAREHITTQAPQETGERIQSIILYAVVFFSLALLAAVILQRRHEKRNHQMFEAKDR